MKLYTITRSSDSILHLLCEAETKAGIVRNSPPESFDIGNGSKETKALAVAIMMHYFGASPSDPAAMAEVDRHAQPFMEAFLIHHQMPSGGRFEISSEIIDRWISLL